MGDDRIEELLEWYRSEFIEGSLPGSATTVLRYAVRRRTSPVGNVLIVPGRTEYIEKYLEVAWDLKQSGYSIWIYDHCGQGRSGRLLADHDKGHITDFSIYVQDLAAVRNLIPDDPAVPLVLLSHSLGGTIATLFCEAHPDRADGLILVSPMLQINTGGSRPPFLVEPVCNLLTAIGKGEEYAWGTGPYHPAPFSEQNLLTADRKRFEMNVTLVKKDGALGLGGPTFGWLVQAYRAMRTARAAAISCPTLILRGTADKVVGLAAIA
jgi:lysophospholipase